jgi:site-specific DNA-methyltransferase (adenine-specific)/site-specific DNA-methyltransferase (cytosine-N4-specific)
MQVAEEVKVRKTTLDEYEIDPDNVNAGTDEGRAIIGQSIQSDGAGRSLLADATGRLIAGNQTKRAALAAGVREVIEVTTQGEALIVHRREDLQPGDSVREHLMIADNLATEKGLRWNVDAVRRRFEAGVSQVGLWDASEIKARFLEKQEEIDAPDAQVDKAEILQAKWNVQSGQVWKCGTHFVICGDCREDETWQQLLDAAGVGKVNGVFTSPPYAEQRKKQYGGVPTAEYIAWWEAVQANVRAHLADDGSFFVNIKPHCVDGERVLYVFDLVLAMQRRWGWRFVDELCWHHRDALPGKFLYRFKNQFEPIFHFSLGKRIRFDPYRFAKPTKRQPTAPLKISPSGNWATNNVVKDGIALPGNVISVPLGSNSESVQAASFPMRLPAFFIRVYSDPDDVWVDPFLGSGTTIVAAHQNGRRGLGIEKLPKYCSVVLERLAGMGLDAHLCASV